MWFWRETMHYWKMLKRQIPRFPLVALLATVATRFVH